MTSLSTTIENIAEIEHKATYISEPSVSSTSLDFIINDEEENLEPEFFFEAETSLDKTSRQLLLYQVGKGISILKIADPNITLSSLSLFEEFDLNDAFVHDILIKYKGIDVLINCLEVNDVKLTMGTLTLLKKIISTNRMRLHVTNLGIITNLINLLYQPDVDLRTLVANLLTQLCQVQKPARYFRKQGGIPLLIDFVDIDDSLLNTEFDLLPPFEKSKIQLVTATLEALTHLAEYPKTVEVICKSGFVVLMKKLTESCHTELVTKMMELLVHCVKFDTIRHTVESEGIIVSLIEGLSNDNEKLRAACAHNIAACAAPSKVTGNVVRILHGLPKLVELTRNSKQDVTTLRAITFAVAKLSQDTRNLKVMSSHGIVQNLIKIINLGIMDSQVFSNVLESLAECGRLDENRLIIANSGIAPIVASKLRGNDPDILVSAAMCLGTWARNPDVAKIITEIGGMRLLFSTLNNTTPSVPATSLWALRPLVMNTVDSAEEIRSLTGCLSLLTRLLMVKNISVVSQACGLVAEIAKDPENLQILSDGGLVQALADCTREEDEELRVNLTEAIAEASNNLKNAREFGWLGVVNVLRNFLVSKNVMLHIHAMRALAHLTKVPVNCIMLHECEGVAPVLSDVAAPYQELQELATVVLRNMRKVAIEAENKALRDGNMASFRRALARAEKNKEEMADAYKRSNQQFYKNTMRKLTKEIHDV